MELGQRFETAKYNSSQLLFTFGKMKVRRGMESLGLGRRTGVHC